MRSTQLELVTEGLFLKRAALGLRQSIGEPLETELRTPFAGMGKPPLSEGLGRVEKMRTAALSWSPARGHVRRAPPWYRQLTAG